MDDKKDVSKEYQEDKIYSAAERKLQRLKELEKIPSVKRGVPEGCHRVTYVIDDEIAERMKLYAKLQNRKMYSIVNELFNEFLPPLDVLRAEVDKIAQQNRSYHVRKGQMKTVDIAKKAEGEGIFF